MPGGLLNLIAAMSGHNKIQGGPQATSIDPETGQQVFTYNPYKAKGGFLSLYGTGRRNADRLNAEIGGQAFLGQEEGKRRMGEIKEKGTQERLTKDQEYQLQSLLGKERADQIIAEINARSAASDKEIKTKQRAEVLGKGGIPYDEQTAEVFSRLLSDPRMQNLAEEESIRNKVLTSPQVRESAITSQVQENLAPLFKNQASTVMNVPPNYVSRFQNITPEKPLGEPSYVQGKEEVQTVEQKGGITKTNKETGEPFTIAGDTKVTRGYKPFISPETKNRAAMMPPMPGSMPPTNNVLTAPPVNNRGTSNLTTPEEMQQLLELMMRIKQQQPR